MDVKTLAVVGAGQMGAGIAQVAAQSGLSVVLLDLNAELVGKALAGIRAQLDRAVGKGKLKAEEAQAAASRLRGASAAQEAAQAELAIEAVTENEAVKKKVFQDLARALRPEAILATNTSALSVTEIAAATSSADRVVGMHFFNPAPVLPLVEVVVGDRTSASVAERVREFAEAIGKRPVVCPDRPGFVVNRILIPLLNDCVRLHEQGGISADDLDQAMTAGLNWPIGPLRLIDLIGADVHVHASEALWQAYREPRFAPPPSLVRMVESGRLGRKAGAGFYTY